ncbi:MAG: HAD family hydrolase [Lachnospiraceae bacterium]|nr:HAD family hydrolase [Lachnospiraceae bacterium]
MKRKMDGMILDVDGTLWNSTGIVAKAWTRAVRENGCPDMTVTPEMLQALFGRPMDVIADHLLPQLTPEHRYHIMKVCCGYEHQALREDECRICYPGVPETIRELAAGVSLFIVSNCQAGYIELFLEKTGLGSYITDFECYGNNGKSKSENIRLVVERNALQAPVYVGDTQGDADAAKEAGIPFIFAAYGFGTADHADAEISSFAELISISGVGEKAERNALPEIVNEEETEKRYQAREVSK